MVATGRSASILVLRQRRQTEWTGGTALRRPDRSVCGPDGGARTITSRRDQRRTERVKTDELARVRRTLWAAADELRANSTLSPAEYRGPVLGLIFLAYAEHRFEQVRPELEAKATARRPVTADDYRARSVLFVPDWRAAVVPGRSARGREPRPGHRRGDEADRGLEPRAARRPAAWLPATREVHPQRAAPAVRPAATPAVRRRVRADLRGLPLQLRGERGPPRRRVLHAVLDRPADRRDHRAVPRQGLRPRVRVGRHVRPVRQVRRAAQPVRHPRAVDLRRRSRRKARSRSPR